jgi:tetratricopeptide (TPR) repeat protein
MFSAYLIDKLNKPSLLIFLVLNIIFSVGISQNNSKTDSLESLLISSEGITRIGILDQLSIQYIKSNSAKSLEYAKAQVELSRELQNNYNLQKGYLNCAKSFYFLSKLDSVLIYANKAIVLQNRTDNDTISAGGYMLICNANIIRGNYDIALINGEKALETYVKINDTLEIATTKKNLSYIFNSRGEYEKALKFAMEALKIFELSNDTMRIASGLGTIANIYLNTGKPDLAKGYFKRAKNYLKYQQTTLIYSQVLQAIAGIYRKKGNNDSSLFLYQQALTIAEKMNNPLLVGKINMNMANTLKADMNINEALKKFKKAKSIFASINSEKDINHINYSLGETYLQSGQYDTAEIYLLKSLQTSKKLNHAIIYEASLKQLYLLFVENQNYRKAFQFYNNYVQYHDSIVGQDVQIKIAELETKYETAKKDQQIIELELQKEIDRSVKINQRIIFSSFIFLFIVLLLGIWQKRKKDRLILKQRELYHKKEKQLAQLELEKSKIKAEELQQSILYKSKQLSTHALHMMQKNSMLTNIRVNLKTLSKSLGTTEIPEYKIIMQQINLSLRSDKDWDVFKLYFADVNRNFYGKLKEINPELTTNDHRLCALIKLNMNSKEMASVLNVAPNSIKSSRYRLKKKLGLNHEDDLERFIEKL